MKTPQLQYPKLAAALGLTGELWLKREDQHHYGSHKGRSIPLMITEHHKAGANNFVISSSGNAALAALLAVQAQNKNKPHDPLTLRILVGEHIEPEKFATLKKLHSDERVTIEQVTNPKQQAVQLEQSGAGTFLRQSTDDIALSGYISLAQELAKIPELAAVFIPTSSGTTAQGLHEGFKTAGINPQIHIIQTTTCHPMVTAVGNETADLNAPSLATAIVDKIAHRKEKVLATISNSQGAGWIATNEEITEAVKNAKETTGLIISPNSALSLVGIKKACTAGWKWNGPVAALITGA